MAPENKAGIQTDIESIWSLLDNSILLGDEAKAAIRTCMKNADNEKLSHVSAFLSREKTFIIEFMTRRHRDGSFPDKVPLLLWDMTASFTAELRKEEAFTLFEERKNSLEELTMAF